MSTVEPTRSKAQRNRPPNATFMSADTGGSWVVFAGTMIGLLAVMNLIYGIAAVSDSKIFVGNTQFVYSGLHTWGWFLVVVSVVQGATAIGLFAQVQLARWAGV